MRQSLFAAALAGVIMVGFDAPSVAQENSDQRLGTVHFETSCNETAQTASLRVNGLEFVGMGRDG